ncbi:MAG: DUF6526 family protein [Gemmatimonadetes bacterium]|nr:DUF6526 family protein [Gemmatimonadota bacterium]
MSDATQDLKSHRRFFAPFHYIALPIFGINMFLAAWHAYRIPTRWNIWGVAVAVALVALTLAARAMANTVQDRVIRLEMRLRLQSLITGPLAARIGELSPKHMVGLRFASDAELPGLIERCLSGELANDEAVKKQIKNWQADWLRA